MKLDSELVASIRDDPVTGIVAVCNSLFKQYGPGDEPYWSSSEAEAIFETYAFLQVVLEEYGLFHSAEIPELTGDVQADCTAMNAFLQELSKEYGAQATQIRLQSTKEQYRLALEAGFAYEFSTGDLRRIQTLISELRQEIANSKLLEKDHQRRLLGRLERLQSELHKRVSDLDRFWGLVGDAGVALGKLGSDAKPIVDRIREISDIIWRTQARAEELPSDAKRPLLTDESGSESEGRI